MTASTLIKRDPLKFNPLEDGVMPLDEVLPIIWNGEHVGRRIADGFKTLSMLSAPIYPKEYGSNWPGHIYEWSDLLAQQEQEQAEKDRLARVQNKVRETPSARDLARMEIALYWPIKFLSHAVEWRNAVNRVAIAHAFERDIEWVVRKHGGAPETWRQRFTVGCKMISLRLIAERAPVF